MDNRNYILQELSEISPSLTKISKTDVFTVPASYFENLASIILSKVTAINDVEFEFPKGNPMKVPNGYFDNFSNQVLQKIYTDSRKVNEVEQELSEVAPLLNKISKQPVYQVPENFFQTFQVKSFGTIKKEAKVVSLSFVTKYMRYAVAAIITTIIAISAYLFIDKSPDKYSSPSANISSEVKNLSSQEIIDYLNTHSNSSNVTKVYYEGTNQDPELNKRLKQMSDEEIKQYLDENSEPGEIQVDI
jgi:hypothetical protein